MIKMVYQNQSPILVNTLKYISGFRVNWETAIALNYHIMVLHKPFPFKIMAYILNTIGECTNGVGKEQMENSFVSLKSKV